MTAILTVGGRDVLFVHWPIPVSRARSLVPDPLSVDEFDGRAWISVLAFENRGVRPGSGRLPRLPASSFPQLNVRTYVRLDGEPGVYFLSLASGAGLPATVGRTAFGLPFGTASMELARRDGEVVFRCRPRDDGGPVGRFGVRYGSAGPVAEPEPGTVHEFCVERHRYFFTPEEDRRPGPLGRSPPEGGVRVGTVDREPWRVGPAAATVRENTVPEALGIDPPETTPVFGYSPGFEMSVRPTETRGPDEDAGRGSG